MTKSKSKSIPAYVKKEVHQQKIKLASKKGRVANLNYLDVDVEDDFYSTNFLEFKDITLTPSQEAFKKVIFDNVISIGIGAAGTSKTFTSCYAALELFKTGDYDKIIITKPIEESGEKLGHLPGTIEEKTDAYAFSFWDAFSQLISKQDLETMRKNSSIEFRPMAYMRGSSMRNTIMICDEAQNLDFRQLMLYVTRLGKNTRVIFTGDVSQHDIKLGNVGLPAFVDMLQGEKYGYGWQPIEGIGVHQFTQADIVRHPILIEITERYEQLKADNKLPKNK